MKSMFYLLLCLLTFSSCTTSQKNKKTDDYFILKGIYRGKQADTLFLTYRDSNGKRVEYSTRLNKGAFIFKGRIKSPIHADLMSNIKIKPDRDPNFSDAIELFLSPGNMTIALDENHFDHAKLYGSAMQDEWNNLQKTYVPIFKAKDSLYGKLFALERAGNTPKNHIAHVAIAKELDKYQLAIDKIDYHYISTQPQSFLSAYLLENFLGGDLPSDSIEMFYHPFSEAVKKSVSGKVIEKVIVNRRASAVGSIIRIPSGINIDGSNFNPQTLKIDNYLLLYFWADWANDNVRIKPIYNKYHNRGLDVLAISMDPFKKMWLDSVKKENISMWHNIFSSTVANLDTFYNIRQTPPSLMLLVDRNRKIIGRYRGDGCKWYKFDYDEGDLTDLEKKLDKVLDSRN